MQRVQDKGVFFTPCVPTEAEHTPQSFISIYHQLSMTRIFPLGFLNWRCYLGYNNNRTFSASWASVDLECAKEKMRNLRQGQRQHPGMQGQLWRHHGQQQLNSPWAHRKQFPLASASAKDYFLPFIFSPCPPFLEKNLLHSAPLAVWIKGGKKDKPCEPNNAEDPEQILQINVGCNLQEPDLFRTRSSALAPISR